MINLTKEQTFRLYLNQTKQLSFKNKYNFCTKVRWKCLSCLTDIYVSYKQYGINSIFCKSCQPLFALKPTIVQYNYMRILKNKQLENIEKLFSNIDKYDK